MSAQIITAGPGDSCTYPIGTRDPQCIDYEALMSMDESNHDDIVRELKENEYETQVEVGKKIAASDPSWFGEAASICLRYQAAKKKKDAQGRMRAYFQLMQVFNHLTNCAIEECAKDRTEQE